MSVSISLHQHLIYISDFSFLFLPNRLSPIVSCLGLRFSGCWWKLTTFHMLIDHLSSVKHVHLIFFFFLLDSPIVSVYQNFLKTVLLKSYESFSLFLFFHLLICSTNMPVNKTLVPVCGTYEGQMKCHFILEALSDPTDTFLTSPQKCKNALLFLGFFFPPCFCSF